jgi:hypothetical protein
LRLVLVIRYKRQVESLAKPAKKLELLTIGSVSSGGS